MSINANNQHGNDGAMGYVHVDNHYHDIGGDPGEAEVGTLKSYTIGFILAVVLTAIPFFLVMTKSIASPSLLGGIVLVLAAIQIVVHMVYFLHMNKRSEGGWTVVALIFTTIVLAIMLAGSIWVMHHLNTNMMPHTMSLEEMRNAP